MSNNNEIKSQTQEMFGKVEQKIEALSQMRHNQLVSMIDEVKEKRQAINQRAELSELGKRQEHQKLSEEISQRLENLNQAFEEQAAGIPLEIDAIVEYEEAEEEEDVPFTPTMSEAYMLEGIEALLNMQKQNLLLEEIKQMSPQELLQFAQDTHRLNDDLSYAVLNKFGRRRLTESGDAEAVARFGRLMDKWSSERVPEHRKRAAQMKVKIGGLQSDWRFFFNEVKKQIQ